MAVKDEVLRALRASDGYISGQALADAMGVSRHAVWKAIDRLRKEGYDIEARSNQGYRLVMVHDVLSQEGLASRLGEGFTVEVYDEIDSTNNRARDLAEEGCDEWTVVAANAQSKGRGRMGRDFYSPSSTGIYMSVVVRPKTSAHEAQLLTIAAAAAAVEAIESVCEVECDIKWVNDLYAHGHKIAGILTEASVGLEEQSLRYAVVGIGINVAPPEGGFPEGLDTIAGTIFKERPDGEIRNILAAEVMTRFRAYAQALTERTFMSSYRRRLMVLDRDVTLITRTSREDVHVLDLTPDGALVVRDGEGRQKIVASGEVSLRMEN